MITTYYRVSWDIQTSRGLRHYSREFSETEPNEATAFFIRKQRQAGVVLLDLNKMRCNDDAPFVDEFGRYHPGGCLHVELLEHMMHYYKV